MPQEPSFHPSRENQPILSCTIEEAESLLRDHIREGDALILSLSHVVSPGALDRWRDEFRIWDAFTLPLLQKIDSNGVLAAKYEAEAPSSTSLESQTGLFGQREAVRKLLTNELTQLKTTLKQVKLFSASFLPSKINDSDASPQTTQIFVVHGHDDVGKLSVARVLEKLSFEVVILHEQVNQGRTLLEKLLSHALTASYAVILLAPDDWGGPRGCKVNDLRPRSRENVIFELGLFLGLLGPRHVAVMRKSGVDIPSDLEGLVSIEMDSNGGWQLALAKELAAVGFKADLSRL